MKFLIFGLTLMVQFGCSSLNINESDLSQIPFCNYRAMPAGISDRLKDNEKGVAVNCPGIEDDNAIADIRVMPYPPIDAKIVGIIIVKKEISFEPYCRMIGANIVVMRKNRLINGKGYDIYDAYYSDKL